MSDISIENKISKIGIQLNYLKLDKIKLQLKQLDSKINQVKSLAIIKSYEPIYLVSQGYDYERKE